MGEAKRREELGLPPRQKKKEKQTSKNQLNKILNNLKIKRNSNNYLISGNNYDVENILETLLKNNNKNNFRR